MSKCLKLVIVIVAAIVFLYIYISPYLSLYQLRRAIENNDSVYASSFIDYPNVPQNLKKQLGEHILHKLYLPSSELNVYEPLDLIFADCVADTAVAMLLTPQGMSILIKDEQLKSINLQLEHDDDEHAHDAQFTEPVRYDLSYRYGYVSFGQFKLDVLLMANQQQWPIEILMSRKGLKWKVTSVQLPQVLHHHIINQAN